MNVGSIGLAMRYHRMRRGGYVVCVMSDGRNGRWNVRIWSADWRTTNWTTWCGNWRRFSGSKEDLWMTSFRLNVRGNEIVETGGGYWKGFWNIAFISKKLPWNYNIIGWKNVINKCGTRSVDFFSYIFQAFYFATSFDNSLSVSNFSTSIACNWFTMKNSGKVRYSR